MKQYGTIDDTFYMWFGANNTSGSGGDGASPAADVRLAGAATDAAPVYSPTPSLLSHVNYPAGAYEIAIVASAGNGFAVNNTYAVFCTLAIDSQNPTGFVGSFDTKPVESNPTQIGDSAQSLTDLKDFADAGYDPGTNKVQGVVLVDTTTTNTDLVSAAAVVNEWESQSQADPTGFHVNVKEVNGTVQTANDNGADINAILTDTAEIGTAGAGLTDLGGMSTGMKAEVESEANDALVAQKLDHLIAVADNDDVVDNAIIAKMVSKEATADWSGFVNVTDALEAIRDRGDVAWTTGAGGSDRLLMIDTTIATLASQTNFTLTAGSTDDNAYNNCTIVIEDELTATQKAVGLISNYTGSTKTITLKYDPAIFTMVATDKVYILAENALKSTLANRQLNVAADGDIAGNIDGSVASIVGHTAQTGDSYAVVNHADHGNAKLVRSTTPANALDVSATGEAGLDFDNIKNATGAHTLTNITIPTVTALTGKTGFALSSTGADLILKDSTFALAISDAIWDEILTGTTHNITNSAGRRVREIGAFAIHSGTAQAGTSSSITLAAAANGNDGVYNRNLIVLTDNTGKGQTRSIVDYNDTTKVVVIDRDWRTIPDNTTTYQIVPDNTPLVVDHGVAQGGTSTTITLRAYASTINDNYLCNIVIIIAGTGRGQARLVGSYNGSTKVVTICGDNWVSTPDTTSVYAMIPYGTSCTSCIGTAALSEINAEVNTVLNTAIPGSPTTDSINERIKAIDDLTEASGSGDLIAIKTKTDNLPSGIAKNVALPKFDFYMVLSSDHVTAATGKTVTGQISKDGDAFAGITNAITEVSNGMYKIASGFTQAEMNADIVTLKFTETDCDQRIITIHTT